MQKSPLQYGENIFQSKVIPHFLPKCSKLHHSEMYTISGILYTLYGRGDCKFFTLYGRDCIRGEFCQSSYFFFAKAN